ncbi:MAG: lipoate--protein ligase family protein [Elusimicrobia bacterium]|nr:lipoate--protein ligase family protein [Elusimicrobiota bacterium]
MTLLTTPLLDAYEQMALDELLLDNTKPAHVLRFYNWKGPAVTFGYFQKYEEVLKTVDCLMVRRPTGGGLVFHSADLTFSFIFPGMASLSPQTVYQKIHRSIHSGLRTRGFFLSLWSPGKTVAAAPFDCFSEPSPMDLVLENGRKVLGGSLRRRKNRVLYQGSLNFHANLASRLAKCPAVFDGAETLDREKMRKGILEGLFQGWGLSGEEQPISLELLSAVKSLAQSKYQTQAWNRKW